MIKLFLGLKCNDISDLYVLKAELCGVKWNFRGRETRSQMFTFPANGKLTANPVNKVRPQWQQRPTAPWNELISGNKIIKINIL